MKKNIIQKTILVLLFFIMIPLFVNASPTNGTIISPHIYAWGENSGWVNFGNINGNVQVTDSAITGYAWDTIYGWMNLNPTNGGVTNDGEGNLGGYAWSQGGGWINFAGVVINASGLFTGIASGTIYGRIAFSCTNCDVQTDWRPISVRAATTTPPVTPPSTGGGSGGSVFPVSPVLPGTPINPPTIPIPNPPVVNPVLPPSVQPPINNTPPTNPPVSNPPSNGVFTTPNPTLGGSPYGGISLIVSGFLNDLGKFIKSPKGELITRIIATVGVGLSALISLSSLAFANPLTLPEMGLLPMRILELFLEFFGLRKKNRPWGTVYDSVTKRPLDPVYVSLFDVSGKEITSALTDIDGRYSFLVVPGAYKITAQKTNYLFPSKVMKNVTFDEVYNDLYYGDEILIQHQGEVITKNIPMDPMLFDWNEFAKTKMNVNTFNRSRDIFWMKLSKYFFVIGFFVSLVALFFTPKPYNMIITGVYIFAYILNYIVFPVKKSGTVVDKSTKTPLPFSIVKIFREGMPDSPIVKKITDQFGRYYTLLPKGLYFVEIDEKIEDGSYKNVLQSPILDISDGVLNQDFEV